MREAAPLQSSSSADTVVFFTPGELCERWKIHLDTLDKLELPWVWITPRVRRVAAPAVYAYEVAQRLRVSQQ